MKKILTTIFLLLLSVSVSAQIVPKGTVGAFWVDSLHSSIYVDTLAAGGTDDDTTVARTTTATFTTNLDYEWITYTVKDTGSLRTDSVLVEEMYPTSLSGKGSNATVTTWAWRILNFVRDSSWTNVNEYGIVSTSTSYTAFIGVSWAIRFRKINATVAENEVTWIYAVLARKRF